LFGRDHTIKTMQPPGSSRQRKECASGKMQLLQGFAKIGARKPCAAEWRRAEIAHLDKDIMVM